MKSMILENMFQRQDSNSLINVFVTMDNNVAQVVPSCTKYDNIPTFVLNAMSATDSEDDIRAVGSTNGSGFNNCVSTKSDSTYRSDAMFTNTRNESLFILNNRGHDTSTHVAETQQAMDLNTNLDPRLLDITRQALVDGSLTPLIKEELKYSIQSKRLKEGKQEMKVEFTEPAPDELTPEEVVRVEKRKVQNRMAARRFRDKQKSRAELLEKQCRRMETEQTSLRQELVQVKRERDELKQAWTEHMARCLWGDSSPLFMQQSQTNDT